LVKRSLFDELSQLGGPSTEMRAEAAFSVGSKFLKLLREEFPDDRVYDLVMKAWFRAVKDGNFRKFKRVYNKHRKN